MLNVKYTLEGCVPLEHAAMGSYLGIYCPSFQDSLQRSYLFSDEGAWKSDSWPEEDATAENDLSVEAVTKVTKDRRRHHETTDKNCKGEKKERNV